MARFYFGGTREIRNGDRVVCRGTCDGYRVEGLRGTVRAVYPEGPYGVYACDVIFDRGQNARYTSWNLYTENVVYADDYERVTACGDAVCECCGAVLPKKSVLGSRLFKNGRMCDACIEREVAVVHGYHHGKNYKYNVDAQKITFGFEAEIDAPCDFEYETRNELVRDCVEYARENNYPLVMSYESDGSLRDGGVECVSAPLTIDDFKRPEIANQIKYLFERADELGFDFDAYNHAGLHVHIGRKSLCGEDMQISNAVGLLMGWAVTRLWNRGFDKLSGRKDLEYTHLYDEYERGKNGLDDTDAYGDRYYCVNITNSRTIELRIFNNATCYEDVITAVDVCYMLGKWATKKINAYLKRNSYSAKAHNFTDALAYADRITWDALAKYSKFPEITLNVMRRVGINV